jgi:hypothetical protein
MRLHCALQTGDLVRQSLLRDRLLRIAAHLAQLNTFLTSSRQFSKRAFRGVVSQKVALIRALHRGQMGAAKPTTPNFFSALFECHEKMTNCISLAAYVYPSNHFSPHES